MKSKKGSGMNLFVVSLMCLGSLFLGAAIQAQERPINVVTIECNGNCGDSSLGELCSLQAGPSFRPIAVDCQNVQEPPEAGGFPSDRFVRCPGRNNNTCFVEPVSVDDRLDIFCDDTGAWDAHIYCEQVTTLEGRFVFGPGQAGVNRKTITFRSDGLPAFTSVPNVIVTPRGENITFPDVFAITTLNVTTTSFQVNVFRIDGLGEGWGQNLQIDWRASDGGTPPPPPPPCPQGFGAEVSCKLPDIDEPMRTACLRSRNPTLAACEACVTGLRASCEEREGESSVTTLCRCGAGFQ